MKFTKPDEKMIKRMTVRTVTTLINTLEDQKAEAVKPLDVQITYYKKLREQKIKEEQQNAETSS